MAKINYREMSDDELVNFTMPVDDAHNRMMELWRRAKAARKAKERGRADRLKAAGLVIHNDIQRRVSERARSAFSASTG
jgi:hypothetical protein